MVLLEFSVSPLGAGESVSPSVVRCLEIVEQSGLDYQLHAMGTLVEGELDAVLDVLRKSIQAVAADHDRVTCSAKLDVRARAQRTAAGESHQRGTAAGAATEKNSRKLSMSQSQVAAVLGRVPSGLFVLSAVHDGEETGMLVSWVMQAGFEPPMISLALRPDRHVAKWIAAGAPFALNVLAEDQKQLVGRFGRGFEPGEAAFEGLEIVRTPAGLPALADAMGYLECRAKSHIDSGDHRVFSAEVTAAHMLADGQPYVHIRKNGLRY